MKIFIQKGCEVDGKEFEEGTTYDVSEKVGKALIEGDYGQEQPEIEGTEDGDESDEEESDGLPKKLNNMIHTKYQKLWGEDYEVPKKELLQNMFGKEHTDELTEEEAGKLDDELDERINKRDVEEKAEEEVRKREETEISAGEGQVQVLKQNQKKEDEGMSVDKARELADDMASPEMVKDLIEDMDFSGLGEYIWDPEEETRLPYDSLEPKVSLYEMVHPLWEMYTGWSYNIDDFEFNIDEENDIYECTITIIRKGGPSDPTTIRFTKTKQKDNLMKQSDIDSGEEKSQWKEYMQSLAYKRAMRPQMRLWVDKFVRAYKQSKK